MIPVNCLLFTIVSALPCDVNWYQHSRFIDLSVTSKDVTDLQTITWSLPKIFLNKNILILSE